MPYKVIIASSFRKLQTGFNGEAGLAAAKKMADDYKREHGVNCTVVETREVYTTTTVDEAEGEHRAREESIARNESVRLGRAYRASRATKQCA